MVDLDQLFQRDHWLIQGSVNFHMNLGIAMPTQEYGDSTPVKDVVYNSLMVVVVEMATTSRQRKPVKNAVVVS